MWFHDLMGFSETSGNQVRANLVVADARMTSKVNGATYGCGHLETPSLGELRSQARPLIHCDAPPSVQEIVADVQQLHQQESSRDAVFQVASQFNLLEMVSPNRTPDEGVGIYEFDRTQGPACAIACGAGTIYRNYFASVDSDLGGGAQVGQTKECQIDCLAEMGTALGNDNDRLWTMQNGYALATGEGLAEISQQLKSRDANGLDQLRAALRIGVHRDVQVTLGNCQHCVTQVYASALPVAYSKHSESAWRDFACMVLEAAYEATLCAAQINFASTGNNRVFMTLLGGGAFGNQYEWIFSAIKRVCKMDVACGLDLSIVSYGGPNRYVNAFIENL